jgi:hypothetical protein
MPPVAMPGSMRKIPPQGIRTAKPPSLPRRFLFHVIQPGASLRRTQSAFIRSRDLRQSQLFPNYYSTGTSHLTPNHHQPCNQLVVNQSRNPNQEQTK